MTIFNNIRIKRFRRLVYKQFSRIEMNPKVDVSIQYHCHGNVIMYCFKFYPETEKGKRFCKETGWYETGGSNMKNLIHNIRVAINKWINGTC